MPSLVETIIKKIKILVVKNRFLIFREKLLKSIIQPKVSNEKKVIYIYIESIL